MTAVCESLSDQLNYEKTELAPCILHTHTQSITIHSTCLFYAITGVSKGIGVSQPCAAARSAQSLPNPA